MSASPSDELIAREFPILNLLAQGADTGSIASRARASAETACAITSSASC